MSTTNEKSRVSLQIGIFGSIVFSAVYFGVSFSNFRNRLENKFDEAARRHDKAFELILTLQRTAWYVTDQKDWANSLKEANREMRVPDPIQTIRERYGASGAERPADVARKSN